MRREALQAIYPQITPISGPFRVGGGDEHSRAQAVPGSRLGAFNVVARLGGGGQGEVYLARPWDERLAHRVATDLWLRCHIRAGGLTARHARRWRLGAIKVARATMADSLLDEHGHLAAPGARHRHLACLYSARFPGAQGQRDMGLVRSRAWPTPRLFLGLAFEAGTPLSLLLQRRGGLPPDLRWSVAVVQQVAQALAHLHARGVVHHDVRPANVIVRPGPHAVLIDLGAAETPVAPRRRAIYGAEGWLPPERRGAAPAPASPQVDIYGAGLLLQALTTRSALPAALSALPAALSGLIADALAPDPRQRREALPTAGVLVERLGDWLAACDGWPR